MLSRSIAGKRRQLFVPRFGSVQATRHQSQFLAKVVKQTQNTGLFVIGLFVGTAFGVVATTGAMVADRMDLPMYIEKLPYDARLHRSIDRGLTCLGDLRVNFQAEIGRIFYDTRSEMQDATERLTNVQSKFGREAYKTIEDAKQEIRKTTKSDISELESLQASEEEINEILNETRQRLKKLSRAAANEVYQLQPRTRIAEQVSKIRKLHSLQPRDLASTKSHKGTRGTADPIEQSSPSADVLTWLEGMPDGSKIGMHLDKLRESLLRELERDLPPNVQELVKQNLDRMAKRDCIAATEQQSGLTEPRSVYAIETNNDGGSTLGRKLQEGMVGCRSYFWRGGREDGVVTNA